MNLHAQTSGSGPDLVLIHGWGLHSGIWDGLMPLLEPHVRVTRIDLPGHGRSAWQGETRLDDMVDAVTAVVPDNAAWLGWSLGGLVAMRAAARPATQIEALLAVASSPCFVRKHDWHSAMLPQLLDTFASDLAEDYLRTLDRFLALQVRGSEQARSVLKTLQAAMQRFEAPRPEALQAGLQILAGTDLRDSLADIHCPALLVAGERDTLVPLAAMTALQTSLPGAQLEIMTGAGHAPFIADPVRFAKTVTAFVREALAAQRYA
jgi:pimeloyl-[acyl-carrier protein] methyl ester esterase